LKKILIIGANSSISEHCARIWAKRGSIIYLVGRNTDKIKLLADDLLIRGASNVDFFCMDINQHELHLQMYLNAKDFMNDIDIVLIAHGTLPDQDECENDVALTLDALNTNALSTIALLTLLSNEFKKKKNGVIATISSVAGDRGRQSNYIYGSAKSMVTTYTSGLRQKLRKYNVSIITILPGLIDTPMTKKFKKNFIWSSPIKICPQIIKAIDNKKSIVYLPQYWAFIMLIIRNLPEFIVGRYIK
jgi:decaprenylphospho-beta-D-erythro-pentofuranosid-2-ulose 2-reductase